MLDLPRYLLTATLAVLPLLVLTGTRFGFELPKMHLAVLTSAALLAMAVPRLKATWTSAPRVAQVTMGAAGLFAAVIVLATVLSDAPGLSMYGPQARFLGSFAAVATVVLVLVVPAVVSTWRDLDVLLRVLAGVLIVFGLFAITQRLGWDLATWPAMSGRNVLATLGNANFVGVFGSLGAPLAVYLWMSGRGMADRGLADRRLRLVAGVLAVLTASTVWLASSALGALGAVVGATAAVLVLLPRRYEQVQGWLIAAVPLAGPVVGMAVVVVGNAVGHGSSIARWRLWASPFAMVADNPVTGVGWARLNAFYTTYRGPETVALVPGGRDLRADSSHAWLIDVAAETGLPGLVLNLILLVGAGLLLRRAWRHAQRPQALVIAAVAGLLGAHGVGTHLAVPGIYSLWIGYLLIGMAVATSTVTERRRLRSARRGSSAVSVGEFAGAVGAVVAVVALALPLTSMHRGAVELSQAAVLIGAGEVERAREHAQAGLEHTPWWSQTWMELARIDEAGGDPAGTAAALLGAHDVDPQLLDAVQSLAQFAAVSGNQAEAQQWWERSLEIDPYGYNNRFRIIDWALEVGRLDTAGASLEVLGQVMEPQMQDWAGYQQRLERFRQASS